MVSVPLHYLQNASSFINFWAALCDNIYHRFSSENISCLVLLSSNISKSSLKTSSLASPPSLTVSLSQKLNKLNPEYSTILLDHNKSPYHSLVNISSYRLEIVPFFIPCHSLLLQKQIMIFLVHSKKFLPKKR